MEPSYNLIRYSNGRGEVEITNHDSDNKKIRMVCEGDAIAEFIFMANKNGLDPIHLFCVMEDLGIKSELYAEKSPVEQF